MCTAEAGWYLGVPEEVVLCHVGALVWFPPDAMDGLPKAGPPCGIISPFGARGREIWGVPTV